MQVLRWYSDTEYRNKMKAMDSRQGKAQTAAIAAIAIARIYNFLMEWSCDIPVLLSFT